MYSADGAVSAEIVYEPSVDRYEIQPGEEYVRELPMRENVQPIYPASQLTKQLDAVSIIARIIVNETGTVDEAEIVEASTDKQEFQEAVLAAVKTWTFVPLKRIVGDEVEMLPFMQDYRFTFKQENGQAVVVQGSGSGG